mmetsp:Transcript_26715/g.82003  ORF Transcript_26715/g.82003 Transcript_26715/m.82003 type:complete len:228 (-) Transcript_26715:324-1007(-)
MERAVKPSTPKYSIGIKPPVPEPWQRKTPGPGAYRNMQGIGEPSPSMPSTPRASFGGSGRPLGPGRNSQAGGPGTYEIPSQLGPQPLSTRTSSPRPTFSWRTPRVVGRSVDTLGPGSVVPRFADRKTAPQYSMQGRTKRGDGLDTPGPGAYAWASEVKLLRAPAYTISGRNSERKYTTEGGGPGRCREDSALGKQRVSTQKNYPAFSFGARPVPVWHYPSPGPGAYG